MDVFALSKDAILRGTPIAFILAFLFGIASSFGPCMASRVLAVASISRRTGRHPLVIVAAFLSGLVAVYVALAFAARLLVIVQGLQTQIIAIAAALFAAAGTVIFVRALVDEESEHTHAPAVGSPMTYIGIAGLGALAALNFSPCCTPWLVMALTYTAMQGNSLYGATLMVVFALGHSVPVFIYGRIAHLVSGVFESTNVRRAMPLVSSAMMYFFAIYYTVQI